MALRGSLIAAGAGLVFIAASCGSLSTASTIDSTNGDTSLATTVVEPTPAAASEPATTADPVTTTSIATPSVDQTVPPTEVIGARAVSEALASARIRWSDASIPATG